MEKHYARVKKIVLTSMILVPIIPFILVLGIGYYYFSTSIQTSTISSINRIIEDHRQMIDSFLIERKANLEFILNSYDFEDLADPQTLYNVFTQLQKESSAFIDLGVFNEEGVHVAYQGPYRLVGKDYGKEQWFNEVMQNGHYISDIFLGFRRIPHFVIALKKEKSGNTWIIRATIDTYMFNELVKRLRIGRTGESYILNVDGIFQTDRRSGGNLMEKDSESIKYPSSQDGTKTFIHKDERGDKYCYATTWLKQKKWLLVVRQLEADAFSALRSAGYLIIFVTFLGVGTIIALAFFLTDRFVRRLEEMDSEKEQLGQQLVRASRLAEIGEMATGVAHEINNPLQIIKSEQALIEMNLSELKESGQLKETEELKELEDSIDQINLQISRCAKITQGVLKFGRKSEPVTKDIDLRLLIPEVIEMIANIASVSGIEIKQDIAENMPPVRGDPSQLQQVLLNLYNNAIDAIIEKHGSSGGELIIQAGPKENNTVEISVRDNGCGISHENLQKIFSPFFTTKPVGKGTGLGLSVCYGIIDSMGGTMEAGSEKGIGTIFTIHFPAAN